MSEFCEYNGARDIVLDDKLTACVDFDAVISYEWDESGCIIDSVEVKTIREVDGYGREVNVKQEKLEEILMDDYYQDMEAVILQAEHAASVEAEDRYWDSVRDRQLGM